MKHLLTHIERWQAEGKQVALATVVKVYGSAPQPLGAKMAISSFREMAGSVSGGCVEGAVVEEAQQVLTKSRPRLSGYGISDEWALTAGLACGGQIEVFIERLPDRSASPDQRQLFETYQRELMAGHLIAVATVIQGGALGSKLLLWPDGRRQGSTGRTALDHEIQRRAGEAFQLRVAQRVIMTGLEEKFEVLIDVSGPPPKLIVVGGVHIAIPLVGFANTLGFHTVVIDARGAFATLERFPHADEVIVRWPADSFAERGLDANTYVVFLTHDEKIDNPALLQALNSPARYVGALGSRRTHAGRVAALRQLGASQQQLDRIYAPVGLDLGGRTPEEVALAIMAQIVAVRNGRET